MTMRTTDRIVTFHRRFCLNGVDRVLPPADYRAVTDEELIEGLSFVAYHQISTVIFVPAPSGAGVEVVTIDCILRLRRTKLLPCTNCTRSTEWHRWVLGLSGRMSAHGTKQTSTPMLSMSALRGKAPASAI